MMCRSILRIHHHGMLLRFLTASFLFGAMASPANPWNGKVVLQAFWWDYWNNNHPAEWSTYLAELAPRLRELGIDAVWIPPTSKNKNATSSVGYAPFDHYDLGDKFQGGTTRTRFGDKDEYLRAVAVLHANGIEVIQDIVLNHIVGAGSDTGAGGEDPAAPGDKFKNFRYTSWATPGTSQSASSYLARRGRFPKNWQNFHPNPDHNTQGDEITAGLFGPDICYYREARGLSSNAGYNPAQASDYMRNDIRSWLIWLKKQTGVNGFRIDASKHFETWATKDFVWNLAYNAGFASGGPEMFCVGEYVGSAAELDAWVDGVNNSSGFTDVVGTFDFSLRGALKSMTSSSSFFNLGSLPGTQQQRRNRTVPFVNSHDTFRPQLDGNGRYIGWDTGNELGGHIDPNDPRIQAAQAVAFAVDGSPCVFFEDLFDLHSTGKRWTHSPTNQTDLPARDYLRNLIWCHQKLNFKDGAYNVRWQAQDLLVIERSARAIIGVNDNWDTWQTATVQTDFGANVRLHDYSGANSDAIFTDGSGRATIAVPPCDGSNLRRGYCVWGLAGIDGGFNPARRLTTQEWEMADDLGDSHANSLRQGGALPVSSTASRTAGRIHASLGRAITVNVFQEQGGMPVRCWIEDPSGKTLATSTNSATITLNYTPDESGWLTLKTANAAATNVSQRVWIKASYSAPRDLGAPTRLTLRDAAIQNIDALHFQIDGPSDVFAVIESSPDLTVWNSIATNAVPSLYQTTVNSSARYFRIRAMAQ